MKKIVFALLFLSLLQVQSFGGGFIGLPFIIGGAVIENMAMSSLLDNLISTITSQKNYTGTFIGATLPLITIIQNPTSWYGKDGKELLTRYIAFQIFGGAVGHLIIK